MKILVFMSDNRSLESNIDTAQYNSLAAVINYTYCKQFNYDFLYYQPYLNKNKVEINNCIDPRTRKPRHSAWSKLLSTRLALELPYDYIVYIDSDCIFKDFTASLEDFIKPFEDKDFIFLTSKPWNTYPCSGFYVCKRSITTQYNINHWYNYDFKSEPNPCKWEQGALWKLYNNLNIQLLDLMMFKEEEGQMLRHIPSCNSKDRVPYFLNFIKEKNIVYDISEIKQIPFSTRY